MVAFQLPGILYPLAMTDPPQKKFWLTPLKWKFGQNISSIVEAKRLDGTTKTPFISMLLKEDVV